MPPVRGQLSYIAANVYPELSAQLDAIAARRGLSRSDVVREMLSRGLANYQREQKLLRQAQEEPTFEGNSAAARKARPA